MSLLVDVPYSQKDEVKALGAFWNNERKKWYVKNKYDYPKFKKWILNNTDFATIICDHIYIVIGKKECFKCHRQTTVIGLGLENYYEISEEAVFENDKTYWYYYKDIHIASELSPLPEKLLTHLKNQYNYYKSYSKTLKSECYANHCEHCNIIQGNFFLFEEPDSPFSIDSKEAAENLKLIKIPLEFDLILDWVDVGYGSEDYLIKQYGKFENPNMDLSI